jgi:hypothetical protein
MANRREEKGARREERLQREQERLAAERRRQRIGYVVAALLVLATIGVVAFALTAGGGSESVPKDKATSATKAAAAAGCSVRTFPAEGRGHTGDTVTYKTNPPTSGDHDPVPAPDGVYTTPQRKENLVHSLEHGRIELQYRPDAPAAARAGLKAVFDESPDKMLLLPNGTGMKDPVAATAWTRLITCPAYNARVPAALRAFRDTYRDKAPESIP